ncbi:hypothetical protein KAR91_72555 [Candidatus Pacearchaeota archaeon]|nr:hypothetical protein [Candidatus Pacearchaeota archaeon]
MSLIQQVVIPKQKAAETVNKKVPRAAVGSTFQVNGDLGTDVIAIKLLAKDGVSVTDAFDQNGNALQFDSTRTSITMNGRASLQFVKPATANSVGIEWER